MKSAVLVFAPGAATAFAEPDPMSPERHREAASRLRRENFTAVTKELLPR